MRLNIIICDDDEFMVDIIKSTVEKFFWEKALETDIYIYTDVKDLMENDILQRSIDVMFLDIDMGAVSGIDLAKRIRNVNKDALLIYISNMREMVFEAMRCNAFRFIRKNHMEELDEALDAICNEFSPNKVLEIRGNSGSRILNIRKIMYIESYKRDMVIHTMNEQILEKGSSLKTYKEKLEDDGFVQVAKSYLVNLRYVYSINRESIVLTNHKEIRIARGTAEDIKVKLLRYVRDME